MKNDLLKHFQIDAEPAARPEAMVSADCVRFTILTPRLVRIEHSPTGAFEDRASQAFWYRQQPTPEFRVTRRDDQIEIRTDALELCYHPSRGLASLSIRLRAENITWHYGDPDTGNLHGTTRTLDGVDGAIKLEPGLMSRGGWTVVDDSASLVFNAEGWLEPRRPDAIDFYFFGYGQHYQECLNDFFKVSGRVPLIPRWLLGNWWSRYWEYSENDLKKLMQEFRARQVPLSVCIVDMDWHTTATGNACTGWTGYTWNRELFPDPPGFIAWLHAQGLRTALNLHPAEGIHAHEAQYEAMARWMGRDPATREPIAFDPTDPNFVRGYFEILHYPYEEQGVDFWWLDWQQGTKTKIHGLDPLWWLNHLHFSDQSRAPRRPFIFSRWGGLGNHRYPIGFSGDTIVTWASLAFQPYFTATAANVGYTWWSHDIGGHWRGTEDGELYARWVQFGLFSPILRLHSTKNAFQDRRPWAFGQDIFRIVRDAMQLRHAFIPYLYTMAYRNTAEGVPLIRPMYYAHPETDAAYQARQQYYFGSELIVAPFTAPRDPDTRLTRQSIWLPPGDWFDFFTGEHYAGDRWISYYGGLDTIPVLARAGAIVPLEPRVGWGGLEPPTELTLHIFPCADNRFELYEDDGETNAYREGHSARTAFSQTWNENQVEFKIERAQGETALVPERRNYVLVFRGIRQPDAVELSINGAAQTAASEYDAAAETLTLHGIALEVRDELRVTLTTSAETLTSRRDRRAETCRALLRQFRLGSQVKQSVNWELDAIIANPNLLLAHELTGAQADVLRAVIER